MKRIILALAAVTLAGCTQTRGTTSPVSIVPPPAIVDDVNSVALNAYGMGVGMDQYGRPVRHDPMLEIHGSYGLGVGMDQYGRPIRRQGGQLCSWDC